MDTTAKGTAFEIKVKSIVEELLKDGEFSIAGNFYEVFHKKGYYSDKRKSDIIIDLSIEFRRTEIANPSLYVFIECKDYKTPVPVSDIEEFYAKANQISGVNVKALLFTTSSIQEGGFTFANSVGMGIVRILDDDSLSWMIERTTRHLVAGAPNSVSTNVMNALLNEYFVSTKHDTFAFANAVASYQVKGIISSLLHDINQEPSK